jgi:hypothetical protein
MGPRLAAVASPLCAAGETDVCQVIRSWLGDGIVTMLMDTGLGLDGRGCEATCAAFVRGDDLLAGQVP